MTDTANETPRSQRDEPIGNVMLYVKEITGFDRVLSPTRGAFYTVGLTLTTHDIFSLMTELGNRLPLDAKAKEAGLRFYHEVVRCVDAPPPF